MNVSMVLPVPPGRQGTALVIASREEPDMDDGDYPIASLAGAAAVRGTDAAAVRRADASRDP
jgi:hypothetical protein